MPEFASTGRRNARWFPVSREATLASWRTPVRLAVSWSPWKTGWVRMSPRAAFRSVYAPGTRSERRTVR